MSLKVRIEKLEVYLADLPGPEVLPGANAEDVALAILDCSICPQDLDRRDPRGVEAVTILVAAKHFAASYLADPKAYRPPMSCPRLIAAWERALASKLAPTSRNSSVDR